jgi:hypothetical protein
MPWINLTVRKGTFTKEVQHAVMSKLTDALMFWEKIPDTPEARKKMKGWVYLVDEDSDYNGGTPHHKDLPGPSTRLGETLQPQGSRPEPLCRAVNRDGILAWYYHGHVIYHGRVNYLGHGNTIYTLCQQTRLH